MSPLFIITPCRAGHFLLLRVPSLRPLMITAFLPRATCSGSLTCGFYRDKMKINEILVFSIWCTCNWNQIKTLFLYLAKLQHRLYFGIHKAPVLKCKYNHTVTCSPAGVSPFGPGTKAPWRDLANFLTLQKSSTYNSYPYSSYPNTQWLDHWY